MELHLRAMRVSLAMQDHGVTYHPIGCQRPVLDLPTPEGWKAELT